MAAHMVLISSSDCGGRACSAAFSLYKAHSLQSLLHGFPVPVFREHICHVLGAEDFFKAEFLTTDLLLYLQVRAIEMTDLAEPFSARNSDGCCGVTVHHDWKFPAKICLSD